MESFEFLIERGVLTPDQLQDAIGLACSKSGSVWDAIVEWEYASYREVRLAVLEERGMIAPRDAWMQTASSPDRCLLCGETVGEIRATQPWHCRDENGESVFGCQDSARCGTCLASLLTSFLVSTRRRGGAHVLDLQPRGSVLLFHVKRPGRFLWEIIWRYQLVPRETLKRPSHVLVLLHLAVMARIRSR